MSAYTDHAHGALSLWVLRGGRKSRPDAWRSGSLGAIAASVGE